MDGSTPSSSQIRLHISDQRGWDNVSDHSIKYLGPEGCNATLQYEYVANQRWSSGVYVGVAVSDARVLCLAHVPSLPPLLLSAIPSSSTFLPSGWTPPWTFRGRNGVSASTSNGMPAPRQTPALGKPGEWVLFVKSSSSINNNNQSTDQSKYIISNAYLPLNRKLWLQVSQGPSDAWCRVASRVKWEVFPVSKLSSHNQELHVSVLRLAYTKETTVGTPLHTVWHLGQADLFEYRPPCQAYASAPIQRPGLELVQMTLTTRICLLGWLHPQLKRHGLCPLGLCYFGTNLRPPTYAITVSWTRGESSSHRFQVLAAPVPSVPCFTCFPCLVRHSLRSWAAMWRSGLQPTNPTFMPPRSCSRWTTVS